MEMGILHGCAEDKEEEKEGEIKVHDSPPSLLAACLLGDRRSSVSLFIVLNDDTATDHSLSPHSSPNPTPTALEGRTRFLLAVLRGRSTSEHDGVQTDLLNTHTAAIATCNELFDVTTILAGHTSDRCLH
ncbi:hypothetical protein BLNAU_12050 [Blattamonas nauphoetae]|uniref:Uncharacterized protein n=1 Tax=Blattamonas nauphoetae TaxID=2049346 RepID=A0ABQ9XKV1_9EUKA|nr:hypothetical protein BLNAU_12050 [Blattamonas nauphoetae]